MARKATPSGGAGRKRSPAKTKAKTAARKPAKAAKPRKAASTRRASGGTNDMTASEALVKLIESPLVADLLAVGATAALAALAGHRFSGERGTRNAVKAAGVAAATAMARRVSTEVEEIRKVSKTKQNAAR